MAERAIARGTNNPQFNSHTPFILVKRSNGCFDCRFSYSQCIIATLEGTTQLLKVQCVHRKKKDKNWVLIFCSSLSPQQHKMLIQELDDSYVSDLGLLLFDDID